MNNRAAVLYQPGDLRVESRDVPEPGPREVLIEIRSVGVCGSDVHYFQEGRIGDMVVHEPMILGHETSGVVVARGGQARRHEVGQRVALEPGVPCGQCRSCREGHYNLCPDVRFFATPPVDGTLAHYVALHEDNVFALPDSLSDDAGALLEPLSVAMWAVRRSQLDIGDRVAVAGAGPVGLLTALVARAAGASSVVLADVDDRRLARAREFGIAETRNSRERGLADGDDELADVFFDCAGVPEAMSDGLAAVRPAGTGVFVGMCARPEVPLPHNLIQRREIWVTGTFRYAHTYPRAIAMAAAGDVDLDAFVDARFDLDRSEEALLASQQDPGILKSVVRLD